MNSSQGQNFSKKVANIPKAGLQRYNESSSMGKVIFIVVLILFIALIIYIIWYAVKASQTAASNAPIIVNDVIDAYIARPAFKLPQVTQGMNQSFSTWIYVKDWNYQFGNYKCILWKGNPTAKPGSTGAAINNNHCPSLWLYPDTNSLKVITSTSAPSGSESCDVPNIPLMSWVHIAYVLNNRTVDIYINGKLERSCALMGIPIITNDPVYITPGSPKAGFYGKIGKTIYYTYSLLPNDVANLYQQGPLGNTNYQIQFFQDGNFVTFTNTDSIVKNSS